MNFLKASSTVFSVSLLALSWNSSYAAQASKSKVGRVGPSKKMEIITSGSGNTPTNSSISTISDDQPYASPLNLPVNLAYELRFFGPQIDHPGSGWTPTDNNSDFNQEGQQDPLRSRHTVSMIRKFNQGYSVSANMIFDVIHTHPSRKLRRPGVDPRGALLQDGYVAGRKNNTWNTMMGNNAFSLSNEIRYYVPLSDRSTRSKSLGSARFIFDTSFKFGQSIFSFTTREYAQPRFQTVERHPLTQAPQNVLELYTGPQINAQVSNNVNLWLCYEAAIHLDTLGNWDSNSGSALTDIEPGLDIQFAKYFTVSPYLNWYPALPISTTTYNVALSASL